MLVAATALAALVFAGLAVAGGHRATLKLHKTRIGKIVVNGRGFTLYMFTKDTLRKDNCVKLPGCTELWPPVTSAGRVIAKPGIQRRLVGTIKLPNGRHQVTYNGWPLYTYKFDEHPAETSYVGVFLNFGKWYAMNGRGQVINRAGKVVKTP
jgi:predicted lipoprotein with Yx(FWY)xxD motif